MMKMSRFRLAGALLIALAVTAAVCPCRGAEVQSHERGLLNNLLTAVENNDYQAFLKDASSEVKAALTKPMLEGVSGQLAPHMKAGYTVTYLGTLSQQGCTVYLWKLTYQDGYDDTLAKLVVRDNQVAGFWLQ